MESALSRQEVEWLGELVRRAMRRFRDHEDQEDITQEAWLSACIYWPRVRHQYTGWVVARTCCRSAFTRWIRSKKARQPYRDQTQVPLPQLHFFADVPYSRWPAAADPALQVIHRLGLEADFARAFRAMTPRQAEVIQRTILAGDSYAVAARKAGIAKGTVGVLVMRGLKHARRALSTPEGS